MKPTHDLWWPFLWGHKLWAHCQIIPKSRYIMISEKITKHHRQFPSKTGWLYFWQKIFHVLTPQVDSCTEAPQAQWEEGTCHMAKYHDAAGIHRVFTVSSPSKIGREESTTWWRKTRPICKIWSTPATLWAQDIHVIHRSSLQREIDLVSYALSNWKFLEFQPSW